MVTAAYLSFTIAMIVVVLLAWRMRADAVEALERSKADARRGRHAQALAADMANISQALVLSLDVIDPAPLDELGQEALEEARESVIAFTETLRAAQYLVQNEPMHVRSRAEGWVRVSVAGARGEGLGIRVVGFGSTLRVAGRSTDVARILDGLIFGLAATVPPKGFVQIELLDEGVDLSAPIMPGRPVDARVAKAVAIAAFAGWRAMVEASNDTTTVRLRPADSVDEPEPAVIPRVTDRLDA
jgi:hypothetical protein